MEEKHKQLRSICRDMGPRLPEIIAWYRALPEEKQLEWNYPVIVWREFQNAHRPTPTTEPRRTKHEETVHELEQRHAATVTALHAENAELVRKAAPSDAEAARKIQDLAASDTIARGGYGQ